MDEDFDVPHFALEYAQISSTAFRDGSKLHFPTLFRIPLKDLDVHVKSFALPFIVQNQMRSPAHRPPPWRCY